MHYQLPPEELADFVNISPDPLLLFGANPDWIAVADRPSYPSIELFREPVLKLAGLRINPETFMPQGSTALSNPRLRHLGSGEERPIRGLPEGAAIRSLRWSSRADRLAFCVCTPMGLQLWVADFEDLVARPLTPADLNNCLGGDPYDFFGNDQIIVKRRLPNQGPPPVEPAAGPLIQDSRGKEAANRTYSNLLQSPYDEALFRYYISCQLYVVDLGSGEMLPWAESGLVYSLEEAPGSDYCMLTYLVEPFSYRVPCSKFADRVVVVNKSGELLRVLANRPATDDLPAAIGTVIKGRRRFQWRSDHPCQLYWTEALDGGDPRVEVAYREQLYFLEPPFDGVPQPSIQLPLRYGGIYWGSGQVALVADWRWKDRKQVIRRWCPDDPSREAEVIFDLNWEDSYNDPGSFVSQVLPNGHSVLLFRDEGRTLLLSGSGHSEEGQQPFLAEYDIETGQTKRVWESAAPYFERPLLFPFELKDWIVFARESKTERPNFYLRHYVTGEEKVLTAFPHPYPKLLQAQFELVKYERADGVKLSGELHLPAGFQAGSDKPLPVLMWAYPREYKDAALAGQVLVSPYQFTMVSPMGPLPWITRDFAVFDDFAMPIVGEGDQEPNETFIAQVQLNARAAVEVLVTKGVADPSRIYVGGHSYGAFMTANLLAHTDLFAGGIARSGAYNRTLTPFGFQAEERTLWEAPTTYLEMSPFLQADKINSPLLLIHGKEDSNSGTHPLQSQRFFEALDSLGKKARLVQLPYEEHGYRAKESILHMLYEMDVWMQVSVEEEA